jgi:Uma2 family endonuclease
MSTKVMMDVEEYLRTSFELDCEYLDGEIVERNMGEIPHGDVQFTLSSLLRQFRKTLGIRVLVETRVQISARRFRIPDIAVWKDDNIGTRIPTVPPFLAVEILSPEDRMVRMALKIQEYLSVGVQWVWVIDPEERAALVYSQAHPEGVSAIVLQTQNPNIEIPLENAFDLDA